MVGKCPSRRRVCAETPGRERAPSTQGPQLAQGADGRVNRRAGQDEKGKDLGLYPKKTGVTEIFKHGTDMMRS